MSPFRLRSTAVLVAAALCAAGLGACGGPAGVTPLSVRGNLLVAGSDRFVARGVADYVIPFYDGSDGTADPSLAKTTAQDFTDRAAMFAAMHRDGINVVRIPLSTTDYLHDAYGLGGPSGYVRRVVETVHAAQRAGLRVLLCWWDSLGWGPDLASRYRTLWPMAAAMTAAVGNDPDVFYEPFNEPNGIDWSVWQRVVDATLIEWRTVLHYHGVLVLDTIGYSWSFSPPVATAVRDFDASLLSGHPEVVFANHRYPNGAKCFCGSQAKQFSTSLNDWVQQFPVLGTEYGIYNSGYPPNTTWVSQLLQETRSLEPAGFNGSILFVWNWVDPNSLTAGGQTLTAYGRVAEAVLWSQPAVGTSPTRH